MKRKMVWMLSALMISTAAVSAGPVWGAETEAEASDKEQDKEQEIPEDGVYSAVFETDSGMFHVNEACEDRGTLTVKDGEMTIHVSLVSKSILNLFAGTAEEAQKEDAELLEPTTDTVTYSDGLSEEVYGFDIPVPVLDEEFDVALIGKKGKWYDHKVSVSDLQKTEESSESAGETELEDGEYTAEVTLDGGTGKATVESPAKLTVENGNVTAEIIWSSPNYDYMLVNEEKYTPVNTEGNSTFEIPVQVFDEAFDVIADTVAMSTPHEIEYTLQFDSDSIEKVEK